MFRQIPNLITGSRLVLAHLQLVSGWLGDLAIEPHRDFHSQVTGRLEALQSVDQDISGVGAGAGSYADLVTLLVWVDAPPALCLDRGIARDGEALRPEWLRWREQELEVFRRERTRDRADVLVDGTGEAENAVVWA